MMNISDRELAVRLLEYIPNTYEVNCSERVLKDLKDNLRYNLSTLLFDAIEINHWSWEDWYQFIEDNSGYTYYSTELGRIKDLLEDFKEAIKESNY